MYRKIGVYFNRSDFLRLFNYGRYFCSYSFTAIVDFDEKKINKMQKEKSKTTRRKKMKNEDEKILIARYEISCNILHLVRIGLYRNVG